MYHVACNITQFYPEVRNDPQGQAANDEGKRGSTENTSDLASKHERNVQRSTGNNSSGVAGID